MALNIKPLPLPTQPILGSGVPLQPYWEWFLTLDKSVRSFFGFTNGAAAPLVGPLTALAAPTNANAAAAGVPVGGLYTSTADPAPVYIRTA